MGGPWRAGRYEARSWVPSRPRSCSPVCPCRRRRTRSARRRSPSVAATGRCGARTRSGPSPIRARPRSLRRPPRTCSRSGSSTPTTWSRPRRRSSTASRTSATGPAASTRSTSGRGSRAGRTRRSARHRLRRSDRVVGRGRGRRGRANGVLRRRARRSTRCAPTTGGCAGSTRSDGAATTTTRPRSSRRRSSPTALVIFGIDVHNSGNGEPAGVIALDAATGTQRWNTVDRADAGRGRDRPGCGDVWGSPSVDAGPAAGVRRDRQLRQPPDGYGRFPRRSSRSTSTTGKSAGRTSPTSPTATTSTSPARRTSSRRRPGAGRARQQGRRVLRGRPRRPASSCGRPRSPSPGSPPNSNFSTGGFIGPTAVRRRRRRRRHRGRRHALPARHRRRRRARSVAAAGRGRHLRSRPPIANGVVFLGGNRLHASAPSTSTPARCCGRRRYGRRCRAAPAIVGDDVFAVAGIREPGARQAEPQQRRVPLLAARQAGRIGADATTKPTARPRPPTRRPRRRRASASPCPLAVRPHQRPLAGDTPTGDRSQISLDPFKAVVKPTASATRAGGSGPAAPAQQAGATRYARVPLRARRQPGRRAALHPRRDRRRAPPTKLPRRRRDLQPHHACSRSRTRRRSRRSPRASTGCRDQLVRPAARPDVADHTEGRKAMTQRRRLTSDARRQPSLARRAAC